MGIDFCYRSDNRRGCLYCMIPVVMIILLVTVTYIWMLPNTHLRQLRILFIIVDETCVFVFVPISFITLLLGLRQRYAALNSHLRY